MLESSQAFNDVNGNEERKKLKINDVAGIVLCPKLVPCQR